jgi:glycosyltransferase involved in cell wall biosynthesis
MSAPRPAVSVVVPFGGDADNARRLLAGLDGLRRGKGDEVVVADNCREPTVPQTSGVTVVRAVRERSAYHARNVGAEATTADWLLFLDADCEPEERLLDALFDPRPGERCGAVAGQILGDERQPGIAARYARSRRLFDHEDGLIRAGDGGAGAGNLLVRRAAFEEIGGFAEGIRSGGDIDLCRRLRAAGWSLEFRPRAVVRHRHRETLPSLLGAFARYGAGARWLDGRYPGEGGHWPLLPGVAGSARDVFANAVAGRFEEAAFRAIDAAGLLAHHVGYRGGNRAGRV